MSTSPAPAPAAPMRLVAGRSTFWYHYHQLTSFYSETHPHKMHEHNRQMADAGCELFMLCLRGGYEGDWYTSYFWRDDGVYGDESDRHDGLTLEDQANGILAKHPNAVFMVRTSTEVPKRWADQHPDHLQTCAAGVRREASYASRLAAEGRAGAARAVVRWVESRPWGERVIGYMTFGQDEGTTTLAIKDALFDLAPIMQTELRAYLHTVYASDAALQQTWGDPQVTRATATVPTDAEWHAARAQWQHWPAPSALRRYQDYFRALRLLLWHQRRTELAAAKAAASRPVVTATDALKQPMLGWLIRDAFEGANEGMTYRNILLASGSFDIGPLLDMPELDALITPADYTARSVGFGWEAEGIGDSLVLRGKTLFIEDDARSWASDERTTQGAWRNVAECRAGLLRNLALAASRNHFPYWMNVGGGYFDDPEVLREVAAQVPVRRKLLTRPHVETPHAIAMILDDSSPLDEDFTSGFQQLAVLRQRNDHLSLTGLPWRIYLLSDLEREHVPAYRTYLFPNLFRLTPARLALLRRKVLRDGQLAIFGPGTGISDDQVLSAAPASELLGFPLELVSKEVARRVLVYGGAHPALAGVREPLTYGDSYAYGPLLQPAADLRPSGAVELGKASAWWQCNRAGLVLKEHGRGAAGNGVVGPRGAGDYAVVWSMATPLPAALLRSLALYAGCNPWSDLGDVVAASGNLLAVHSVRPGPRRLHLPAPALVHDAVSGEHLPVPGTTLDITLHSPDTRVFTLDPR